MIQCLYSEACLADKIVMGMVKMDYEEPIWFDKLQESIRKEKAKMNLESGAD